MWDLAPSKDVIVLLIAMFVCGGAMAGFLLAVVGAVVARALF